MAVRLNLFSVFQYITVLRMFAGLEKVVDRCCFHANHLFLCYSLWPTRRHWFGNQSPPGLYVA